MTIERLLAAPSGLSWHHHAKVRPSPSGSKEREASSVNEFLSFRRFKILPDRNKGFVSHEEAVKKAEEEYNEFNKTQKIVSDFDKEISLLLGPDNN